MRKEIFLVIGVFFIILLGNAFVSAVCCEKLKNSDLWCVSATNVNLCNASYNPTKWQYKETCENIVECSGTCINAITGECSESTPKAQCKESGGTWNESSPGEIKACQEVCCLLGQDAYFINPTECAALFTQKNIKGIIRTDITSRAACEELRSNVEVGACVTSTLNEKICEIKAKSECIESRDVRFYTGKLCTASMNGIPISDCARSTNTECKDNKVYFKDLCGNFANIYDSKMFTTSGTWKREMIDYWTYIKDPYYSLDICNVTSVGSSTCGNCDPADNTVCRDYTEVDGASKPDNNANGLICGDLSCKYKDTLGVTRTYKHGESWCEGSAGTFDITRNLTTSVIFKSNITQLENMNKYNLPGSRYYKLICSFGEVLVEECGDYRNSVCMEGKNDYSKRSEASCVFNNWRTCFQIDTKKECEDNTSLCKWIPGYRWDAQIVPETQRKERQGSCSPLVAPGFDFWEGTSQGNAICGMGSAQESALFETNIYTKRSSLTGPTAESWPLKDLANRCVNGCYSIPQYGKEFNQVAGEEKKYPEEISTPNSNYQKLTLFYDNSKFNLDEKVGNYFLSTRRGQYCHKHEKPDKWVTGQIWGRFYDCTQLFGKDDKTEEKQREYPVYLTNDEWINSITERARSIGDCGYKIGINGKYSAPETEMITAIFQKMTQKGTVKENVTVEQIIYKGGKFLTGNLEKYETVLPSTSKSYSCASDFKGICTSSANNPEPCSADEGGTLNTAGTCPEKMVCCIYPELGAA